MQGFNRYYPPDYDPKDAHKGNLNRLAGKAPQKPVVRFEMPFNIWCLSCSKHIAQGVRFNAKKRKSGMYFSSPIYSFSMNCHLCSGQIEIVTNPRDTRYDIISGARQQVLPEPDLISHGENREIDPFARLEGEATRKKEEGTSSSTITALIKSNDAQWSDGYTTSQKLRTKFRAEKKVIKSTTAARRKIEDRHGLGIELLDPSHLDRLKASQIDFEASQDLERRKRRVQRSGAFGVKR